MKPLMDDELSALTEADQAINGVTKPKGVLDLANFVKGASALLQANIIYRHIEMRLTTDGHVLVWADDKLKTKH